MLAGCTSATQNTNESDSQVPAEITVRPDIETPNTNESDNQVPAEITVRPDIETPVEENFTKPLSQEESMPVNWYIRLVAEDASRALKTNSAQLGVLEENDAVVKHTLLSHGRFSGPYLDIVFIDPDGVAAGTYKTNYHTYNEDIEERWRFTVQTDDKTSDIVLTWNGLYALTPYTDDKNREQYKEYRSLSNPLIKHMKLVDAETGKEIAASNDGKVQTYVFNMNGQNERVFEWVVQADEVIMPVTLSNGDVIATSADGKVQTYSVNKNNKTTSNWTVQVDALANPTEVNKSATDEAKVLNKSAKSFDLSKPPTMK